MMGDGLLSDCKECHKRKVKENRNSNIEYYREFDRKRAMQPHRVAARSTYAKGSGKLVCNAAKTRWVIKNRYRKLAINMLNNAVRDGKVIKEPCEVCGTEEWVHGHHDDYTKPLKVRWLCAAHHRLWHSKY